MLHGQLTEIYNRVSQLMNAVAQHEKKEQEEEMQNSFVVGIKEILRLVTIHAIIFFKY